MKITINELNKRVKKLRDDLSSSFECVQSCSIDVLATEADENNILLVKGLIITIGLDD